MAECPSGDVGAGLARFAELAEQTATEDFPSASRADGLVRLRYAECLVAAGRSSTARAILEEITDPSYEEDKRAALERLKEGS